MPLLERSKSQVIPFAIALLIFTTIYCYFVYLNEGGDVWRIILSLIIAFSLGIAGGWFIRVFLVSKDYLMERRRGINTIALVEQYIRFTPTVTNIAIILVIMGIMLYLIEKTIFPSVWLLIVVLSFEGLFFGIRFSYEKWKSDSEYLLKVQANMEEENEG